MRLYMKKELHYYKLRISNYFEAEYSDFTIDECIDKIVQIEDKPKEYWIKKLHKLANLYYSTNKHHTEAAAFVARLFRPRMKSLIQDVCEPF